MRETKPRIQARSRRGRPWGPGVGGSKKGQAHGQSFIELVIERPERKKRDVALKGLGVVVVDESKKGGRRG